MFCYYNSILTLLKCIIESIISFSFNFFRPSTPDCAQLCLGEKSWLDGLDGKNDQGVIFTSAVDDNCVYILKWIARSDEDITWVLLWNICIFHKYGKICLLQIFHNIGIAYFVIRKAHL